MNAIDYIPAGIAAVAMIARFAMFLPRRAKAARTQTA
jgi:hypothetical protein